MKKIPAILLSVVLLGSLLCLAACGQTAADGGSPGPAAGSSDATLTQGGNGDAGGAFSGPELTDEERALMESYREIMASPADIQGVITKITGNEVTLDLIEPLPQMQRVIGGGTPPSGDPGTTTGGSDSGAETRRYDPANPPEGFDPSNPPDGVRVYGRDGSSGRIRQDGQSFADQEIDVTYTGETLTVTIPVALSILSGFSAINATQLSKKQVITLWYGDDGQTIAYAMIRGKAAAEGN